MITLGRIDPPPIERRAKDLSWNVLSQLNPPAASMSGRLAENLSTVLACVNAISTAIASLPAEVQRRRPSGGYETTDDHPLARIIRDGPNAHQSWPDFAEWLVASTLLAGNGLAEIVRDRAGALASLMPIMWGAVGIQRLVNGRLVFDVSDQDTVLGTSGRPRRLLDTEVLWLRDRSDDGLVGRSRLQRAAGTLRPAWDLQEFIAHLWQNGVTPSGALEVEHYMDEEQRNNLRRNFIDALAGPQGAARALILDQGLKWRSISIDPGDAQVLESRRFTVEELARLYGVPPPVIGDLTHGSFTNSETMIRWFAQSTLSPWIVKIEREFHRAVFSESARRTHRLDLDLSGLLRGDPETRWQSHKIAVEADILTRDEVRDLEGWPPRGSAA
jgi:HK97 family phage portal protein